MSKEKLTEILEYYKDNYAMFESVDVIVADLLEHDVEVRGDSFYCPVWREDLNCWILLAGAKDHADLWVLKKIIKLIKSGDTIYSILNGNSDYLLDKLTRYNVEIVSRDGDTSQIIFNREK